MPDVKRTRKGRPGPNAQRSSLLKTRGKASGRDAQVEPKRRNGAPLIERKKPLESQLEAGDSISAFMERATARETEYAIAEEESAAILVPVQNHVSSTLISSEDNKKLFISLPIPHRPHWDESTTAEELRDKEDATFSAWRRATAELEEAERARREEALASSGTFLAPSATVATPFERNLDVWRQLWRTLERSDCIFVVVDARFPSFYANDDLIAYAKSLSKSVIILNNKADYLTQEQRQLWYQYWTEERGLRCLFFSARQEQQRLDAAAKEIQMNEQVETDEVQTIKEEFSSDSSAYRLFSGSEVLALGASVAREYRKTPISTERPLCVGMTGYPNVGKSSCVNALRGASTHGVGARAAVSATPGKTKHLQTLRVSSELELCDCPGLVFPAIVTNGAAELVCSGVVPLARARDPLGAADLVLKRIPADVLDAIYGTRVFVRQNYRNSADALDALCTARHFTKAGSGQPDRDRAARRIVRDYVDGILLYCHLPPFCKNFETYNAHTRRTALANSEKLQAKLGADPSDLALATDDESLSQEIALEVPLKQQHKNRFHSKQRWGKKGRRFRDTDPYAAGQQPLFEDDIAL
uniref:CP-type G domain-containing protein n=1 Tax=Aureoumbra lagunensis TaxID=44058 RepID=A0A7S3JW31_9STRA|mmetsp:Transcript_4298/g.6080  ORF Transcript_4298/g.6080 Transcript_4298/m.6080 type:complete len:588 (+) Transcript_4298:35-1798(+)